VADEVDFLAVEGRRREQHLHLGRLQVEEKGTRVGVGRREGLVHFRISFRFAGRLNEMVGHDGNKVAVEVLFLIIGYRSRRIFLILRVPGKKVVTKFNLSDW
jgi:hypothetical protein